MSLPLLLGLLAVEAAYATRRAQVLGRANASVWPEDVVYLQTPLKNFLSGFSRCACFIMTIVTLQTVAFVLLQKQAASEVKVWLVVTFPFVFAVLGLLRLTNLLCKKQLSHSCLQQGIFITTTPSQNLDIVLLIAFVAYAFGLLQDAQNLAAAGLVLMALAGPASTLLNALMNAREVESEMERVHTNLAKLRSEELPKIRQMTWPTAVATGRAGLDFMEQIDTGSASDFALFWDLAWHRRVVLQLTGSYGGFLILPGFGLLIAFFAAVTGLQVASYTCSCAELSGLDLASSLHSLKFEPWQANYAIDIDVSFKRAALIASADAPSTQWVSAQQPADLAGQASVVSTDIEDDTGAAVTEVKLSDAQLHPRVATVRVQGLRPSLPPTAYSLRFSPLQTMPSQIHISSVRFNRTTAWSTLPGSRISLPEDVETFNVTVALTDFFLGLPVSRNDTPPDIDEWTVFARVDSCEEACSHDMNCLMHFPARVGCFMAYNDHRARESGQVSPLLEAAGARSLSAVLTGCQIKANGTCGFSHATQRVLRFENVRPDWTHKEGSLDFALALEVGEQRFDAVTATVQLHRGIPDASDVISQVLIESGGMPDADSTMKTLSNTAFVDSEGDLVIQISKYDPTQLLSMHLVVMPVIADLKFQFTWTCASAENFTKMDEATFSRARRCKESGLLQERYKICGRHGPMSDRPLKVKLSAWTGQAEDPPRFNVEPRYSGELWPSAPLRRVRTEFHGVDSPAAWAVEAHGCQILWQNRSGEMQMNAVLSSADALRLLLKLGCENSTALCKLIDDQALGGASAFSWGSGTHSVAPLLAPGAIVKVLVSLLQFGACTNFEYLFNYDSEELGINRHSAKIPINVFLTQLMGQGADGAEFLSRVQRRMPEDEAERFRKDVSTQVWQVASPSVKVLKGVASLGEPEEMLEAFATCHSQVLSEISDLELQDLQAAFADVDEVLFSLRDAVQVGRAGVALSLATQVSTVRLLCDRCAPVAKEAAVDYWQELFQGFPRLQQLKRLFIEHFTMKGAALGDSLVFKALSGLDIVWLHFVELSHDVAKQLMQALGQASSLRRLSVKFVSGLGAAFPAAMPDLSRLEWFKYSGGPRVDAQGVLRCFEANPPRGLRVFHFKETPGWPGKGKAIFGLLQQMPDLAMAHLQANELGTEDLRPVLENTTFPPKLRTILLKSNGLSTETAGLIRKARAKKKEPKTEKAKKKVSEEGGGEAEQEERSSLVLRERVKVEWKRKAQEKLKKPEPAKEKAKERPKEREKKEERGKEKDKKKESKEKRSERRRSSTPPRSKRSPPRRRSRSPAKRQSTPPRRRAKSRSRSRSRRASLPARSRSRRRSPRPRRSKQRSPKAPKSPARSPSRRRKARSRSHRKPARRSRRRSSENAGKRLSRKRSSSSRKRKKARRGSSASAPQKTVAPPPAPAQ
ncbi:PRPF4B, partial [Symbiodinium sp. CCMP2456]